MQSRPTVLEELGWCSETLFIPTLGDMLEIQFSEIGTSHIFHLNAHLSGQGLTLGRQLMCVLPVTNLPHQCSKKKKKKKTPPLTPHRRSPTLPL